MEIIIVCRTCQHINAMDLGMPRFEAHNTEYDTLSAAIEHFVETQHILEITIIQEEK